MEEQAELEADGGDGGAGTVMAVLGPVEAGAGGGVGVTWCTMVAEAPAAVPTAIYQ